MTPFSGVRISWLIRRRNCCSAPSAAGTEARHGRAEVVAIADNDGELPVAAVLAELRRRGHRRVFIEGGGVNTGCGGASSAMGPFYCPADQTIYIDTAFYDQLDRQLGAGPGDFARYYVIAHEYGHHVQTISGLADQIRSAQSQNPRQANQLQVMMELHADCYAGVWAGKNRNAIEPGDLEEGMQAASAIGDDKLSGGRASPESFTHGTSAQRMQALRLGLESGDDTQCDQILQVG